MWKKREWFYRHTNDASVYLVAFAYSPVHLLCFVAFYANPSAPFHSLVDFHSCSCYRTAATAAKTENSWFKETWVFYECVLFKLLFCCYLGVVRKQCVCLCVYLSTSVYVSYFFYRCVSNFTWYITNSFKILTRMLGMCSNRTHIYFNTEWMLLFCRFQKKISSWEWIKKYTLILAPCLLRNQQKKTLLFRYVLILPGEKWNHTVIHMQQLGNTYIKNVSVTKGKNMNENICSVFVQDTAVNSPNKCSKYIFSKYSIESTLWCWSVESLSFSLCVCFFCLAYDFYGISVKSFKWFVILPLPRPGNFSFFLHLWMKYFVFMMASNIDYYWYEFIFL